jgi:superfamily I DNA/RNA helicase
MKRRQSRWEKLSTEELKRERDFKKARLASSPPADFAQMYRTELNAIEAELARRTSPGPAATVATAVAPPKPSRPAPAPAIADPIVRGDSAVRSAIDAAKLESPQPKVASDVLPEDLLQALELERSLYRPTMLRSAGSVLWEDDLLTLEPSPPPDDSWIAGELLGFRGDQMVFSGEIVHVDPATGRVYAAPRGQIERNSQPERWCFLPFDFSSAIVTAADAARLHTERLQGLLQGVCGESVPVRENQVPKPRAVWAQPWGFLWGPPGTGKTQQASALIADALLAGSERVLAVAPTNRAADTLVMRVCALLRARGVADVGALVFRGGIGASAELARAFPQTLRDAAYAEQLRQLEALEHRLQAVLAARMHGEVARLREEISAGRRALRDETLYVAKSNRGLVVVTVHRALQLVAQLKGEPLFRKVVVDEAGMVSRAAAGLVALVGQSVLFAGDPKQIGPVSRAEGTGRFVNKWMRASPLAHLTDPVAAKDQANVCFLHEQHRMHPEIGKVVSDFNYGGQLTDAAGVVARADVRIPGLPAGRANWVVLEAPDKEPEAVFASRAENGRGYVRSYSARVALALARAAVSAKQRVLVLTPYRAQVNELERAAEQNGLERSSLTISTIHRQQGTEADVVIVDTVAGGRPFPDDELLPMLNVAASRAREYLFLISAPAEAERRIPGYLARLLKPNAVKGLSPLQLVPTSDPFDTAPPPPARSTLGREIQSIAARGALFTGEQMTLFRRRIDEGHHLVRGVAGSGKTYVLANWVAGVLEADPQAAVLVSYFNKALGLLIERLVHDALELRGIEGLRSQVNIRHVHVLWNTAPGSYDSVFVDESQDMGGPELNHLFSLARPRVGEDGQSRRSFNLFMDDSQNVYARKGLQYLRDALGGQLNFSGRASVLREAFRSTRQILDLAFNVVLDPHGIGGAAPGMREFMRTRELFDQGLLEEPEQGPDGLFHVLYTERTGLVPKVSRAASRSDEQLSIAREITRLFKEEELQPADVLVVVPSRPSQWAEALTRAGVSAIGFGGQGGADASEFATTDASRRVRVTTIFQAKGHESPVVFFGAADDLDTIEAWMKDDDFSFGPQKGKRPVPQATTPREWEQRRRAMFYVGATRAMIRQYISAAASSRRAPIIELAERYAERLRGEHR